MVLSLACSAAVVLSWKSWAEGFPRTCLWGRAGCSLIWSKAGGCKPAVPPTPCIHLPALWAFAKSPRQSVQGHRLGANSPARALHFGQSSSWAVAACAGTGHHKQCGMGSEPRQHWLGLPECTGLWSDTGVQVLFLPSPAILIISGDVPPCPVGSCRFLAHHPCCLCFTTPFLL